MKFEETIQEKKSNFKVSNDFPLLLFLFIYKNKFLNFFLFLKLMVLIILLFIDSTKSKIYYIR